MKMDILKIRQLMDEVITMGMDYSIHCPFFFILNWTLVLGE